MFFQTHGPNSPGQWPAHYAGLWGLRGPGGQGISLLSLNQFHHRPSVFLQKVGVVIYGAVLGVFTLDFTRNLFVNGRKD